MANQGLFLNDHLPASLCQRQRLQRLMQTHVHWCKLAYGSTVVAALQLVCRQLCRARAGEGGGPPAGGAAGRQREAAAPEGEALQQVKRTLTSMITFVVLHLCVPSRRSRGGKRLPFLLKTPSEEDLLWCLVISISKAPHYVFICLRVFALRCGVLLPVQYRQ